MTIMTMKQSLLALVSLAAMSSTNVHAFTTAPQFQSSTTRTSATYLQAATESTTKKVASDELLDLINTQVTNELSASQLYLSASIWCEQQDLSGMAKYMRSESAEERSHAMGFIDYANKRDFPLELEELEAPDSDWNNVQDLWEKLLKAEEINTQNLLRLANVAQECGDHATTTFLMPFHTEQIDSEDNLKKIIAKVKDEKKTPGLLRQLDDSLEEMATEA